MDEISSNSFCLGTLYGFFAAGGMAMLLSRMREARGRMASQNRAFDNFPDAAQPGLTAARVVNNSKTAMWAYAGLLVTLVFFVGLTLAGAFFILRYA